MLFVSRTFVGALTRRFLLGAAVAVVVIASMGTSVRAALVAQGPALRFQTPALQGAPRGPLTFNPFNSPPLGTSAQDLTVGPDDNLWITTQNNPGTIVRMTPKGVSTAFTYPVGSNGSLSLSITPGPDGALWFVDYDADLVGKVTTKGVVTTYPLPTQIGCGGHQQLPDHPLGITAGPDGAMWFTLSQNFGGSMGCPPGPNPAIGRITTTGQMTFYTMPSSSDGAPIFPYRITSGPDGLLWFTTNINNQGAVELGVGSIATSGAIHVSNGFPGTSPQDAGDYLTFSSKQLYVADTNEQTIIHVSGYAPAATFPIPGIGNSYPYGPYGITEDSHGRLWFTTHTDGGMELLGSMTRSGQFTMYQVPSNFGYGCCGSVAFREKQRLWFIYGGTDGPYGNVNVIEATNVP